MFEYIPGVAECCKNEENLKFYEYLSPTLIAKQCKVCKRKHYEAIAEPGNYNFQGKEV